MTPKGMLNRIVWKLSNPNDLIIRGPNAEMPPLAILLQMLVSSNSLFSSRGNLPRVNTYEIVIIEKNQHQVLRSKITSRA